MRQQYSCCSFQCKYTPPLTFISVPPCALCPSAPKGYFPDSGLRSLRAEMAFSALYAGVQLHLESGSCLKSLYLKDKLGLFKSILQDFLTYILVFSTLAGNALTFCETIMFEVVLPEQ